MADTAQAQFWDERYAPDDYVYGTAPNAFLAREAHRLAPGSRVLAVADGEGRNSVFLAQHGHEVLAVDVSPRALEKAGKLAARRGVTVEHRLADLAQWDWPEGAFDAVVAIFIQFAPPPVRDRIFSGFARTLRPGGLLLLQGYRPEQLALGTGGPPSADVMYTETLLRDAFADWDIDVLTAHDSVIVEGTGHDGMSALIDLVARKR
ncbi:class I SAM-dependent methyltransferase [Erythrobacteraceae bacterium CFH 75059]|uniref:SAM-dependent methyltransferase n=1 Tax=Qipengyuania thermophila TaxID=2509361 RepID=UPI00101F548F|nr:class I SAM-dependent methyltransferase [Qipengyuania thermophila]TCD04978.1 class I SAM-dependent methyltransferase [Erythrobacteraceae bacterium CFH 75059]